MKVKELIKQLQALKSDNLEVYTAVDDEGNGYNKTYFAPTVFYREKSEAGNRLDASSVLNEDDIEDEDYDKKDYVKIVVI